MWLTATRSRPETSPPSPRNHEMFILSAVERLRYERGEQSGDVLHGGFRVAGRSGDVADCQPDDGPGEQPCVIGVNLGPQFVDDSGEDVFGDVDDRESLCGYQWEEFVAGAAI